MTKNILLLVIPMTVVACGGVAVGPVTDYPDPCITYSVAELSEETVACNANRAPTCGFSGGVPVKLGTSANNADRICNCRTTNEHPYPENGVYYCMDNPGYCQIALVPPRFDFEICGPDRVAFTCDEPSTNPGACLPVEVVSGFNDARSIYWCC